MNGLTEWQSFYVLVGSAAGALIGLQFVVMALVAEMPAAETFAGAIGAFGTPTIVDFSASLLVSGVLSAPWHSIGIPAILCGITGLVGVVYILIVTLQMRKQTAYRPEPSDWFFYVLLPLAAYAAITASAYAAAYGVDDALFGVGVGALLLLFIGIHNAWDSITYHIFVVRPAQRRRSRK